MRSAKADSASAAAYPASNVSGSQSATTKAPAVEATAETSPVETSTPKATPVETSSSASASTACRGGLTHC